MKIEGQAKLLRIFLGECDKVYKRPLYEAIVYGAKKFGIAGATVTRGIMSFGANSKIHTSKLFALSDDLPIVIEMVDSEEKIAEFVKIVDRLFDKSNSGGLITLENIHIVRYKAGK